MNLTSKIKEYFQQTSKGERVTGAIGLLVGIGILFAQWKAFGDAYLRYVTIAITLAYTVASLISANELCARLKRVQVGENKGLPETKTLPLSVLKARWKLRSERLSVVALLGFGITQYRVALEIDNFIAQKNAAGNPAFIWAMVQSMALIGLLMSATLAISRKLALAKFDYKEAVEEFDASQREKAVDENRNAEDLAREALKLAQEAIKAALEAEKSCQRSLEKAIKAKTFTAKEAEVGQTAIRD